MACRTMLITSAIDHPSGVGNMTQFKDGEHLVYYPPDRPEEIGRIIAHYLRHPEEREAIAEAGWREIRQRHTLRQRVDRLVADAEELRREKAGMEVVE
jgi:spore maturation protein CgeB